MNEDNTKKQYCAPVVIPTLNRYEHFKRCIESLSRCTWAEETEVYVGLDYPPSEKYVDGYNKIRTYLNECGNLSFKQIHVIKRDYNWGAEKNSTALVEYVFQNYEVVIYTEDDNEFSPCFLDYMNKALEIYKDSPKVRSVCGYLQEYFYTDTTLSTVFVSPCAAWGIGMWRKKESEYSKISYNYYQNVLSSFNLSMKLFFIYPRLLGLLQNMVSKKQIWGDVMRSTHQILNGDLQIRPSISLVRNWGHDGSGLHCGKNIKLMEEFANQKIMEAAYYPIVQQKVEKTKGLALNLFFAGTDSNHLVGLKKIILVLLRYIMFRFKGKQICE